QTIALAGTVDISGTHERARFLGYIQFASSLGTISGPIIGGFLSDSHVVSWFTFATPFYFSAILAVINLLLVYFCYNEMYAPNPRAKAVQGYGQLFMSAVKTPKIRQLSIIALLIMLGWSAYYTTISFYLQDRLQYSTADIAEYLAISAIGFMFGTLYLINVLKKVMQLSHIIIFGLLLAASSLTITLLTANAIILFSLSITLCCGFSLAVTALLAQFSNNVADSKQGWVMGISQAITAFAFGVTGIVQAFVNYYSLTATMIGAVIILTSAAGVTFSNIEKKSIANRFDIDGGKKYD
ncbi:MAG: MFS transporter, partial [Pseudomonadota bacterium]|nr:MFS transporter [Pseudomonadota bacterium]